MSRIGWHNQFGLWWAWKARSRSSAEKQGFRARDRYGYYRTQIRSHMSRIGWQYQFDHCWPWKFQVNERNLRCEISRKWWDLHYTLFVSIEEYYEIAYCLSREGMKTLAFLHPGSRNSRKQQYLPFLRAKAFKSCLSLQLYKIFQVWYI